MCQDPKDLSHIHSSMSLHSPTDMGSSDEGSFLQAFDDDDEVRINQFN
jgi:hypothetical protein